MSIVRSIRRTATKLYSGSKKLRSTCSGNIRPVRRTLALTVWEQSSSVDWWGRNKNKNRQRCYEVLHSLRRDFFYLLTCRRRSLVSGTQNDTVVSWTTLWWMIKVYWLDDFSLHFGSRCLLRVSRKFGPKLASHSKAVKNELKFVELSEPCSAK